MTTDKPTHRLSLPGEKQPVTTAVCSATTSIEWHYQPGPSKCPGQSPQETRPLNWAVLEPHETVTYITAPLLVVRSTVFPSLVTGAQWERKKKSVASLSHCDQRYCSLAVSL